MSDQARTVADEDFDLAAMWRTVWRGKLVVIGFVGMAALLALAYLNTATYYYTAQLKVVPATKEGDESPAKRLGGLAAITGLNGGGAGELPFILYKQGLQSREVAKLLSRDQQLMRHIFAGEWDGHARRWREPESMRVTITRSIKNLLGLRVYPWAAPDAARLQQFLQSRVTLTENPNSPVVTIQFDDPDPVFAADFLARLSRTVDQSVRRRTVRKTGDYINYLSQKLVVVSLAEHRASLAAALTEQERQRMLASSSAPFAAEPIDEVVASTYPTAPRPGLVLGAAVLAGLLLGVSAVLVTHRAWRLAYRPNQNPEARAPLSHEGHSL